jgi:non-hemolytic enterotoxin B/C
MTQLNAFSTQTAADATTLGNIATQALSLAGADQSSITNINTQIDNINSEIAGLNYMLGASEIGIGVSLFFGVIGVAVCFIPGGLPAGAVIIGIAVLGEAASIAGTVVLNEEISNDQTSITDLQQQVQNLDQNIIALQACNRQFVWLQQANQDAQAALQVVINMWSQLQTELQTVKTELTDVNTDVTAAQYAQAITDLNAANAEWQQVVQFAQALAGVNYQWQDQNGNWHSFSNTSTPVTANGAMVTPLVQAKAA